MEKRRLQREPAQLEVVAQPPALAVCVFQLGIPRLVEIAHEQNPRLGHLLHLRHPGVGVVGQAQRVGPVDGVAEHHDRREGEVAEAALTRADVSRGAQTGSVEP